MPEEPNSRNDAALETTSTVAGQDAGAPGETQGTGSCISFEDLLVRLEKVSDRLSAQVRTLALGIIAFTWALLVGDSGIAKGLAQSVGHQILTIGGLAITSLFFDFLQYVSAYWNANRLRKSMERQGLAVGEFNYRGALYLLQGFSFAAKQVALLIAAIWLIVRLSLYVRSHI